MLIIYNPISLKHLSQASDSSIDKPNAHLSYQPISYEGCRRKTRPISSSSHQQDRGEMADTNIIFEDRFTVDVS